MGRSPASVEDKRLRDRRLRAGNERGGKGRRDAKVPDLTNQLRETAFGRRAAASICINLHRRGVNLHQIALGRRSGRINFNRSCRINFNALGRRTCRINFNPALRSRGVSGFRGWGLVSGCVKRPCGGLVGLRVRGLRFSCKRA